MTARFTRRRFLHTGLAALALRPAFPSSHAHAAQAAAAPGSRVSIFHTTDLHGNILPTRDYSGNPEFGGLARLTTLLRRWREEAPNHLTIDCGDLYQGTEVGYRTRGQVMIDALNHLEFDAWVAGNHEFDWGAEAVNDAVAASKMPVLAANTEFDGKSAWKEGERDTTPFRPWIIKETGGFRIAVIGLSTPGMPNWFLPELMGGHAMVDPVPVFEKILAEVEAQKPDAILVASHMGIRSGGTSDDEANRLAGVARAALRPDGTPRVHALLGGHTHQDHSSERVQGIPYTQANFFGSRLGRIDIDFDPDSRKPRTVTTTTTPITADIELDPGLIALTRERVEEAEAHLDQAAGEFSEEFSHRRNGDEPTDIERLIGASILDGLRARDIKADAVLHGMLFSRAPLPAGKKTIRDAWSVIPFENFLVTAELTLEAIQAIAAESRGHGRTLMGMRAEFEGRGANRRATAILDRNGRKVEPSRRFLVAFNSYDAAGGGGRLTTLRAILAEPASKRTLHQLQSRALLVDFLNRNTPLAPRRLNV